MPGIHERYSGFTPRTASQVNTGIQSQSSRNVELLRQSVMTEVIQQFPKASSIFSTLWSFTKARSKSTDYPGSTPYWIERGIPPQRVSIENAAGTGVSFVVNTDGFVQKGTPLFISKGLQYERADVTAHNRATRTLTVVRGRGDDGTIIDVTTGTTAYIGAAFWEQASPRGDDHHINGFMRYNEVATHRIGTGYTEEALLNPYYDTRKPYKQAMNDLMLAMFQQIDTNIFSNDTMRVNPVGTAGSYADTSNNVTISERAEYMGIPGMLGPNTVVYHDGPLLYSDMGRYMRPKTLHARSDATWTCFGHPSTLAVFDKFGADIRRWALDNKTFGMKNDALIGRGSSSNWTLKLVPNVNMQGDKWGRALIILQLDYLGWYSMTPIETRENEQPPSWTVKQGSLLMRGCPIVCNADAHLIIHNVTE